MFDLSFWIVQFLHGLQFSMLLYLLSIGLTIIFGLLHFVNLAHGVFYALGAYIGFSIAQWSGSYWLGFVLAPLLVALIGLLLYASLIRHMRYAGPMNQVLVTFGLIFVFVDLFRMIWGSVALGVEPPALLAYTVNMFGITYPAYRLFVIALGLGVMTGLHVLLSKTQIGAMIRASVDNENMAACLGINVERTFVMAFALGCALAGLAGIVAAPVLSVTPDMGMQILIPTLIVVVIGGLGNIKGAAISALMIGFLQTFGAVLAPELASVLVYILLAAILILRPGGLFPARS